MAATDWMFGDGGLDKLRGSKPEAAPPLPKRPASAAPKSAPAPSPPAPPPAATPKTPPATADEISATPTDRVPALRLEDFVPPAPALRPATPPAATPRPPAAPATRAAPPPAPMAPVPARPLAPPTSPVATTRATSAPGTTSAPGPKTDELNRRALEHTAKLRRALLEGKSPAEVAEPPQEPAPQAPASAPAPQAPASAPLSQDATKASPDDTAALRRAIADRTQKTTLQALEKKGVRNVSILGLSTIEKIVADAVENALEARSRHLTGTARKQLEHEARREFFELLEEHKRTIAAKTDEERRRLDLEKQVERLRTNLAEQEEALADQRSRAGVTISPDSIVELEGRIRAVLAEFMTAERRGFLADADEEKQKRALAGLDAIEKQLGEAFDRLVGRLKSDYEGLLERRIEKLNKALHETEDALRRVASMKMIDDGIASIYKNVQGLDLTALNFERKKELLAVVFLENLELQGKQITDADRQAAVVQSPVTHTRAGEPAVPADMDFQQPLDPITTETAF